MARSESPLLHAGAADALLLASAPLEDGPEPVAVVLADGTVRSLAGAAPAERTRNDGQLSGRSWMLWWQRRQWVEA
jgi:hypothetical protein